MKAIVRHQYGSPDVIRLEEVEKPSPGADEVLVRVRAAALNAGDHYALRGQPLFARTQLGLLRPQSVRLGSDFAGEVEAVGRQVTQFKPGDKVFSGRQGAFAEYVTKVETTLAPMPANLTFEQAAAVPVAGITALQGLRDYGRLQAGQKVLINGASGGVGTFAVQIAKALGGHVTAVCSPRHVGRVRALGAERVIDYTREDFTQDRKHYDLLFDNAGSRSFAASRRVLTLGGLMVVVGAPPRNGLLGPAARLAKAVVMSRLFKWKVTTFIASIKQPDLLTLKALIEDGKVTPVIDRCYPLEQVPEALRYLEEGHARGKIVITVP
jgi:NADPH:quinone reductase-like Zn-dependent oxidoreductase